jgi:hypothetical protein
VGHLGCPVVHRTGPVDCPVCSRACSDSGAHCSAFNAVAVDRWHEVAVAPLAHRTVRCDTRHCPVNYSGAAFHFPEGGKFIVECSGAPDTVRWHTGQSGAPDQGAFWDVFSSLYLNPSLVFLLVCCEPLAPIKLID